VRNPRTDVTACGYGYSETEMLIRMVTYLLNTLTYNGSFFDKNSIPRGLLQVFGNYSQGDLAAFKRQWNAMTGHRQRPQPAGPGVQGSGVRRRLHRDRRPADEMAFGKWLSFLTSVACAIYQIAPEEISMESFASQSALSATTPRRSWSASTDKGLLPAAELVRERLSDYIIQPFSENYCLRFAGLDDEDEAAVRAPEALPDLERVPRPATAWIQSTARSATRR
jgi:hypothetical protein